MMRCRMGGDGGGIAARIQVRPLARAGADIAANGPGGRWVLRDEEPALRVGQDCRQALDEAPGRPCMPTPPAVDGSQMLEEFWRVVDGLAVRGS